jgi:hypothetical protein
MMDPPRLRTKSGSLEARILRSSPGFEPPAHAQEEVWRRLTGLGAVGATAGMLGLGARTAAAAGKLAGKAVWMWAAGASLAVIIPAAGVTTYWVAHRGASGGSPAAVAAATPSTAGAAADDTSERPVPHEAAPAPIPGALPHDVPRSKTASHATPSALKAESLLLSGARAKFAAGDASGALDDVARLASQFPHGELVQEREVVAIDCLAALGDRAGMRARALAFRERFPSSPYTAHVRQVLGP